MLIDIDYNKVLISSLSNKPIVNKLFDSGLKLNVFEKHKNNYILADWIYKQLIINHDSILINKFWSYKFCEDGGLNKKEFINFQILAFEIKEINDSLNFIKIYCNNRKLYPNWEKTDKRHGRDTKKMIKFYKRIYPTSPGNCNSFKIPTLDNHSKLCCVCGSKNILLLKGENYD